MRNHAIYVIDRGEVNKSSGGSRGFLRFHGTHLFWLATVQYSADCRLVGTPLSSYLAFLSLYFAIHLP